jgi:adenylate kinase family enzyme
MNHYLVNHFSINMNSGPQNYVIFVIGPPNSGKSSCADRFVANHPQFIRLTPGDMLRNEIQNRTILGEYIQHNWNHSALAPIVTEMLENKMKELSNQSVIIDGYPRTVEEVYTIPKLCSSRYVCVMEIVCQQQTLFERAQVRNREGDDNIQSLNIRLTSYNQNIGLIRGILQQMGIHFSCIGESSLDEQCYLLDHITNTFHKILYNPPIPPEPQLVILKVATAIETACAVQICLNLAESTKKHKIFCGTHPISLTRQHFQHVQQFPYLFSFKADGTRYMCVIWGGRMWFIDRSFSVWKGPYLEKLLPFDNTLLDGELIDKTFLVLDVLNSKGTNVMQKPILDRLRSIAELGSTFWTDPYIQLRPQGYFPLSALNEVLRSHEAISPSFPTDGFVFTPARLPYRLGIDRNLFKFKPASHNTVDFLYHNGLLHVQQIVGSGKSMTSSMVPVAQLKLMDDTTVRGRIVECRWNIHQGSWEIIKVRTDKTTPNVDWVAKRVIDSIKDNITRNDLYSLLEPPTGRKCMHCVNNTDQMGILDDSVANKNLHGEAWKTPY